MTSLPSNITEPGVAQAFTRLEAEPFTLAAAHRQNEQNQRTIATDLRASIAAGLLAGDDVIAVVSARLERLIQAEARADVYAEAALVCAHHGDDNQARAHLPRWAITVLARGANDQWSGRTNDVRRIAFDAVRDTVERIVGAL